jgi:DNA helicase II / ATP-dependent DNA helicase PcrA
MPAASHLDSLNSAQRQAAEYGTLPGDPTSLLPLLILAGAGSGKTNTLAHRVAQLILNGADPDRILLLTFSRRAAQEMARRVERICRDAASATGFVGPTAVRWAGTFHAVGGRLLRLHAHSIGLDPSFTILDREDAADLMDFVREEARLSKQEKRFPRKATCLAIYSFAVNAGTPLDVLLAKSFPWCADWETELKRLFHAYVTAKQRQGVLDYDDLLLYWAQMMQASEIAEAVATRFDHVLVDEYQDTNAVQASILLGMKPDGLGLTVVGDDAQSIYSFRAATVRNILDFPYAFTPPAKVVTLEQNYRSTQPILAAANAVMEPASERFAKNLFSERRSQQKPVLVAVADDAGQVGYVVEMILANREAGVSLKRQAVLFRTGSHSAALELELTRRKIPFVKFGGLRFLEAAHVKDVVSVLRWAENPRDRVAGFRVLQLLPGIGPATARKALDRSETGLFANALELFRPPAAAAEDWPAFVNLVGTLRGIMIDWVRQIELVCDWYRPHLERLYDSPRTRAADLDQLMQIAAGYPTREAFLSELTLDPPGATGAEAGAPSLDEDYLILSTIHSAKGQEWDAVYILNLVDGCIPADLAVGTSEEIEEERRLLHVAMTRAKDQLHLVQPLRFYTHGQRRHGDRHVYAPRSRFVTTSMLSLFERTSWPAPRTSRSEAAPGHSTPSVDLGIRLREMWR